ncbi:MAG: TetR family transcriptional regulator [Arachnia propionica]|uniref:TetR/AcrR family transcriptional regulator n=1 Tax=Arachnia propionica TaxID=1750 RepID=UPI00270595DF|nr:TetR family transcriptional regulator [Arachnia propionica]
MARASNRTQLLEAAIRVAEREGLPAVTLESVATEAGLTKGGLLYHFPTRRALLVGVYTHLAELWHADMVAELGSQPEDADPGERLRAYIQVSSQAMSKAELVYLADAGDDPDLTEDWKRVSDRWILPIEEAAATHPGVAVACLAADGLWVHDALSGRQLPQEVRDRLVARILALLDQ